MKLLLAIKYILLLSLAAALLATTRAEPLTRCMGIQPLCPPGQHAICLCSSDLSMVCKWVCGSQ